MRVTAPRVREHKKHKKSNDILIRVSLRRWVQCMGAGVGAWLVLWWPAAPAAAEAPPFVYVSNRWWGNSELAPNEVLVDRERWRRFFTRHFADFIDGTFARAIRQASGVRLRADKVQSNERKVGA
jgi:hypothetical protein